MIFAMFISLSCAEDEELSESDANDSSSGSDTATADTGSGSSESGDTTPDSGSVDTDSGSADTGSADTGSADTGSADTGDTGDTAPAPVTCTGISIESFRYENYDYYADIKETVGGASKDELYIHFEGSGPEVKSYALSSDPAGINKNDYIDCTACVSVFQDIIDGTPKAELFQKSGTLEIEKVDAVHGIKGSLKDAKLVQIDVKTDGNGEITEVSEVKNGTCVEIETAFDIICEPNCKTADGKKDKICGSDGCGGSCGTCTGENEGCSADQTQCIAYDCTKITVNDLTLSSKTNQLEHEEFFYVSSFKEGDSSELRHDFWLRLQGLSMMKETDLSTMTFLGNCKGETSLGDKTDGWPEKNSVCIYIKDISNGNKFYFPTQGTINITTLDKSSGKLEAALSGIRLVNINTDDGIPVAGGKCFEITNDSLNGK